MLTRHRHLRPAVNRSGGFTMMELMIVLGIIALVMGMGVPTLVRVFRKEALRQATSDIVEVASNARAMAIQRGEVVEMVINPEARSASVGGGGGGGGEAKPTTGPTKFSTTWPDNLSLELLDLNFVDFRQAPETRVRFFPNGTSDMLTLSLRNDAGEYRLIHLEVITGLCLWESDPSKFEELAKR